MIEIEGWDSMLNKEKKDLLERLEQTINEADIMRNGFHAVQELPHILILTEDYFEWRKKGYERICSHSVSIGKRHYYMLNKSERS